MAATATKETEEERADADEEDDLPLAVRARNIIERARATKRKRKEEEEKGMLKKHALGLRAKPTKTTANDEDAGRGIGGKLTNKIKTKISVKKSAEKKESEKASKRTVKNGEDPEVKWHTLEHLGVVFPELYTPHGVRPLYNGEALELNADEEEVRVALRKHTVAAMDRCV